MPKPQISYAAALVISRAGAAAPNLKVCSFMICYFPKFWISKF